MRRKLAIWMTVLGTVALSTGVAMAVSTPSVLTGATSNRTESSAILKGSVTPNGSATTYQFEWGPSAAYGALSKAHAAGSGKQAVSVQTTASGLAPGTVYHYRLIAINAAGQAVGRDRTFLTAGHPPPQPVTGGAAAVGRNYALLTGTVNTQGQATSWSIQYGPTPAYGSSTFGGSLPAAVSPVGVSQTISALQSGVTFHYRLVASHGTVATTTYGDDQTFTTFPIIRPKPGFSASTTPHQARTKPYMFTINGAIGPPPQFPAAISCNGVVAIHYFVGRRSVLVRYTRVQPNCTFSRLIEFRTQVHFHSKRLRVEYRFVGNSYLNSVGARTQRVTLG